MNLFHKPRTCNGKNGLVNGINKSTKSANNKKYTGVWKFIVGILLGLLLGSQLQSLLISSSFCVPNKTSVFPIHHRQLKVRSELLTVERTVETSSKSLVSHLKLKQLLLVGVMTADKYIATRAKAVYETWGKQVPGKILFFTADTQNVTDMDLPVVRLKGVDDSYPPQKKSFMMLKYMYEHYGDKFEWFMRADDDVFVRTERLGLFLKNVNSSKASFIGQAGKGILEEFGLLSLEYDENFCMGGPGMILSHITLARVAPHVRECLKNLYTTHEDVELGRCVQKFAGIPCTWSYEMQNIFYHNSSGRLAFTGPLKSREVHRAITLHPVKQYSHMYRLFNYLQSLSVRERIYEGMRIRREMSGSIHQLEKRLSSNGWSNEDIYQLKTLGLGPSLNKFVPHTEDEMLTWNFVARAVDSIETINPRRTIDAPLREGVEDVIREVMESINAPSKERGRIIDFKELLYGYYRVNPRLGVDYILDLLLVYKKYRGRKMMFPVRRHAYLQQAFGPLVVRSHEEPSSSISKRIHLILPLSGRLLVFRRFMGNVHRVCAEPDEDVRLIIVLYPTLDGDDPSNEIKELVEDYRKRSSQNPKGKRGFELELIEQTGAFARASALEVGQSSCQDDDDDCLLFFIDVDMIFDSRTLERIRTHTIRGRQAYFPIVFSQFDPSFVGTKNTSAATDDVGNHLDDVFEVSEDRGYWRFYGFGLAGLYRSDLQRVGGMNTSIRGWGQEDVDLYDRIVASTLAVFRAPDPGLIHVFHPIDCVADSMGAKQRKMCLGTKASTYASQQRLARYWIDSHHPGGYSHHPTIS